MPHIVAISQTHLVPNKYVNDNFYKLCIQKRIHLTIGLKLRNFDILNYAYNKWPCFYQSTKFLVYVDNLFKSIVYNCIVTIYSYSNLTIIIEIICMKKRKSTYRF